MKRFLVPCDYSPPARAAYRTAIDWAAHSGGEVIVLHVIFLQVAYAGFGSEAIAISPEYFANIENRAKDEFEKMNREINVPSLPSSLEFSYGDVVSSIKDFVQSHSIDVIIMGTSGSSGIEEIFIGSNTEKVVRHSTVPVLAVKEYVDLSSVRNILFPTLMTLDQTEFISKLKELQKFLSATLHILTVNSPHHFMRDPDAKAIFKEFAKHYKLNNCEYHFVSYRSEEEGILDFAASQKMDLIAMATHARKGLAHLFNGSVTEHIVNHVTIPVWTCALRKGKSN
jgi:nucleotide-binding universal stress UspA family protein